MASKARARRKIRVGFVNCDLHATWYAAFMQKPDPAAVTKILCIPQLGVRYIHPTGVIAMLVEQHQRGNRAACPAIQDALSLGRFPS